jgi:hypothetical protein
MARFGSILVAMLLLPSCSRATPASDPVAREIAPKVEAGGGNVPEKKAGAKATGQGYVVEVTVPEAAATEGRIGVARVTLKATSGFHVNKEFPLSLKVTAPEGISLAKTQLGADDAAKLEELEAAWDVKFTASAAGDKAFAATFRFAVCTETTCDPKIEKLAWNVQVK